MRKQAILFFSPAFFGYEAIIEKTLVEKGFDVDFFDERGLNNSLAKAIFRFKKSILNFYINKYYNKIFNDIYKKKYNYLFVIKGEVIPERFIINFKINNPNAKLIFFTYDSISNNVNSIEIMKYFHVCYSFDFDDVKNYPFLKLKHLFYTDDYVSNIERKISYEISFVGTLHSNRFNVVKRLFAEFDNTFLFYYMPARWFFYFEKITNKEFKNVTISDISFKSLSRKQIACIFKTSKSVLDIQRFNQSGLSMRTFEVLAAGAILITTNNYIKQTEFYNSENIIIINNFDDLTTVKNKIESVPIGSKTILSKRYNFEKYHINSWLDEFFV